jgi:hypothetical protein
VVPTVAIELTWAPSCTPLRASIETVAGWPTLTLVMSDSLKEIVMVIALASTISANADEELPEEDELDEDVEPPLPRPPAVLAPPLAPVAEAPEPEPGPEPVLAAELLDPADTESPVVRLLSDTIVPVAGA